MLNIHPLLFPAPLSYAIACLIVNGIINDDDDNKFLAPNFIVTTIFVDS